MHSPKVCLANSPMLYLLLFLSNVLLSWTAFLGRNSHRHEGSLYVSDKKGNSTPSPATAQKAKIADSTKKVAKLKTDQASTQAAVAETAMPVLSEKSFDKLPQWDFEDVYNQEAPPRRTVSML